MAALALAACGSAVTSGTAQLATVNFEPLPRRAA
jgi:hypothetical protein